MRSRYRISVNGVQMDTLDDNLLILDIAYSAPDHQVTRNRSAGLNGVEIGSPYFEGQTVTVTFELHIYDVAKRHEALQKVNAWAQAGGTLTTNDRAGQRLYYTRCERYASIASAKNWTDPLTVVFATTFIPYWMSNTAKAITLSGKTPKGTLKMDGNTGDAIVSATITPESTLTKIEISTGDKNSTISKIVLADISVAQGKQLVIDYVRNRFLRIRADGKNIMAKLEPASSDLLTVPCGVNTAVNISANAKVTAEISARGRWL